MISRISTSQMHAQGLAAMLLEQARLAKVQQQLASGQKLTRAADDPAAASGALALDQALAELNRYGENAKLAQHRLGLEENALAGGADVLARVQELAVQANSGGQSQDSLRAISAELRERLRQLVALANSDDGTGRYLFGGTQDGSAPFAQGPAGVTYAGDQGQRQIEIAPGQSIADGDPGSEIFQRIASGNGAFAVTAAAANTGTAVVTSTQLTDPSQWDGQPYQVVFGAGTYQVLDAGANVVAGGAYVPGAAITFRGIAVSVEGTPAAGDSLAVMPSSSRDVFATVQKLIDAVGAPRATAAERAAQQNAFFSAQQDLAQAQAHLIDRRAAIGGRTAALDATEAQRSAMATQVQDTLSSLRDLDYAQATTRLNQLMTALQAAQLSYQRVQGSSLFDYLR